VGLENSGDAKQDVYVLNGALWMCERSDRPVDIDALRQASAPACDLELKGVQEAAGSREAFEVTQEGCGQWMPQEFRMCAPHLKAKGGPRGGGRHQSLIIEDGRFFAQRVVEAPAMTADGGRCKQGAFFHMQEWKKRWGDANGAHIDPTAAYDAFHLSANGFAALRS